MTLEGNNNDLQYEGLTPQVQVFGYVTLPCRRLLPVQSQSQ
jgi:hypothetical protein